MILLELEKANNTAWDHFLNTWISTYVILKSIKSLLYDNEAEYATSHCSCKNDR